MKTAEVCVHTKQDALNWCAYTSSELLEKESERLQRERERERESTLTIEEYSKTESEHWCAYTF